MPPPPEPVVLGLDPGSAKCGLALVARDGAVLAHQVVPVASLRATLEPLVARSPPVAAVVGNGTGREPILAVARDLLGAAQVMTRDERGTTLEARHRYWQLHPPRGLWRLVPTGMRVPPVLFDDLVAVILAERWWAEQEGQAK